MLDIEVEEVVLGFIDMSWRGWCWILIRHVDKV